MRRIRYLSLVALALSLLGMASQGHARPYESPNGYSITPPKGWVYTPDITVEENAKYQDSTRNTQAEGTRMSQERFLARARGGYSDNINMVVVPGQALSEELVGALKSGLEPEYRKAIPDYTIQSIQIQKFGSIKGIHLVATLTMDAHKLQQEQFYVFSPARTVIVTCTMKRSRRKAVSRQCRKSFASVRLK